MLVKGQVNFLFEITGVLEKTCMHTYWYQTYGVNNTRMVMNDPEH
jgi:hypothetical protein